MNKNSAMSYLFLIASGIKHHNVKKKKKVQGSIGSRALRYVNGFESQLKICFKYLTAPRHWKLLEAIKA